MPIRNVLTRAALRLSGFVAAAIVCAIVGTNAHVGVANTLSAANMAAAKNNAAFVHATQDLPKNLQVLSPKDADLYRAAFAAQETGDWKSADVAIGDLTDRRLLGHVLADRYERRKPTAGELRDWLAFYSNLPEAADIYSLTRTVANAKNTKFNKPNLTVAWSGSDQTGTSFGFKAGDGTSKLPASARTSAARIDRALRRGDPMAARLVLENEQDHRTLTLGEVGEMDGRIASGFFYQGETEYARRVAEEAAESQNPLALWIGGLAAWKQGDMAEAGNSFAKLAAEPNLSSWDRSAAAFWAYRSLKHADETTLANYWLAEAAKQPRSFYGFLAAHLLGRDAEASWDVPKFSTANVSALAKMPAGWRALALVQVGQPVLAQSELRHLNPQGRKDLQESMMALAEIARMPSLALQLGGIATGTKGSFYDAALYPVPPWQPEQGFQIDPALLFALMRHESQFDPDAVSNRGACGLMQLMPSTANLVANDNVTGEDCSMRLLDPAFNMALGQKYVRHLANQPMIGDNLLLLLTAYNSGPSKMARWLDDETRNDPLLYVESMPVRETHDYVQQVMIQYWMYRSRLSEPQGSLTQLAHGEWPRVTLRDESALRIHSHQAQSGNFEKVASRDFHF